MFSKRNTNHLQLICTIVCLWTLIGCSSDEKQNESATFEPGTFGYDLEFLQKYQETIVLSRGASRVAICPAYQGRIMTSSATGDTGSSFGWINHDLIKSGEILKHINPVGGEDRFWLGPEGGQFSLYFKEGASFVFDDWQTPAPIDTEPFELLRKSATSAAFQHTFSLTNYSGTKLEMKVDRKIDLLDISDVQQYMALPDGVNFVAFQSVNTLTNVGSVQWSKEIGAPSIWILGMFNPGDQTIILVAYHPGEVGELGPVVNDTYFGKVPEERLIGSDSVLFFRGDGKYRGKIGLSPLRAKPFLGSYDIDKQLLTLVFYTKPDNVADYVNSMWEIQEKPFAGDVVNSYNDGPVNGDSLGPFYELETSSPAAFLKPQESLTHTQLTIHIESDVKNLDPILKDLFGVTINDLSTIF